MDLHKDNCAETVIRRYADMVYHLAFARTGTPQDADDIFQEVFLRYVKNNKPFQSEEHLKAWLIRVTVNCANKLWGSSWQRKTRPLDETLAVEMADSIDLHKELQQLPPKYREVIHLFYYENMTLEEISTALNRKNATVRTQLTRARAMLRSYMKEEDYV